MSILFETSISTMKTNTRSNDSFILIKANNETHEGVGIFHALPIEFYSWPYSSPRERERDQQRLL